MAAFAFLGARGETGTVDAIELTRCPEVVIYGITNNSAAPIVGREHLLDLWP